MTQEAIKGAIALVVLVILIVAMIVTTVNCFRIATKNEGKWCETDIKACRMIGTVSLYITLVITGSIVIKIIQAINMATNG